MECEIYDTPIYYGKYFYGLSFTSPSWLFSCHITALKPHKAYEEYRVRNKPHKVHQEYSVRKKPHKVYQEYSVRNQPHKVYQEYSVRNKPHKVYQEYSVRNKPHKVYQGERIAIRTIQQLFCGYSKKLLKNLLNGY